jgi:hypothetical protein
MRSVGYDGKVCFKGYAIFTNYGVKRRLNFVRQAPVQDLGISGADHCSRPRSSLIHLCLLRSYDAIIKPLVSTGYTPKYMRLSHLLGELSQRLPQFQP